MSTPFSRATNRRQRIRRLLFPSRTQDWLYSKRAAPYVKAPCLLLFVIYTQVRATLIGLLGLRAFQTSRYVLAAKSTMDDFIG